jgi:hypothetical protein
MWALLALGERPPAIRIRTEAPMFIAIVITLLLLAMFAHVITPIGSDSLIVRRPYNNRYSDAAGAREDHLG